MRGRNDSNRELIGTNCFNGNPLENCLERSLIIGANKYLPTIASPNSRPNRLHA
ncbi:hypothetical protein ACVWWI_006323 [Bradyrhizobium sp. USDA 3686]|nr:hypothetical protein [Bradyrhizobium canariense]